MRDGFLSKAIRIYLVIGGAWCLLINVGAAISGAPSAFEVVTGGASAADKIITVLLTLGHQILLWPMDVYDKMGRISFG